MAWGEFGCSTDLQRHKTLSIRRQRFGPVYLRASNFRCDIPENRRSGRSSATNTLQRLLEDLLGVHSPALVLNRAIAERIRAPRDIRGVLVQRDKHPHGEFLVRDTLCKADHSSGCLLPPQKGRTCIRPLVELSCYPLDGEFLEEQKGSTEHQAEEELAQRVNRLD